ncbi:MAG: SURF1 family protein [Chloroflexi bacterium]|nr:SURF1 family protein [Chloroflexota bacterium]
MPTLRKVLWFVFIVTGASAMITLGFWQWGRLQERKDFNAKVIAQTNAPPLAITGEAIEAASLEYRRATVSGVYDFSQEVVLRNRTYNGVAGVHLLTPLKIENSSNAILIDRGWISYPDSFPFEKRSKYAQPTGSVAVSGLIRLTQTRPDAPLAPADPPLSTELPRLDTWFYTDMAMIQKQIPYPILSFYIERFPATDPNELPAPNPELELSEGSHWSYVIQWFSFAIIFTVGSLALMRQDLKRRRA